MNYSERLNVLNYINSSESKRLVMKSVATSGMVEVFDLIDLAIQQGKVEGIEKTIELSQINTK